MILQHTDFIYSSLVRPDSATFAGLAKGSWSGLETALPRPVFVSGALASRGARKSRFLASHLMRLEIQRSHAVVVWVSFGQLPPFESDDREALAVPQASLACESVQAAEPIAIAGARLFPK